MGILAFGYKAPVEATPSLAAQNILEQENITVDQIAAATVAADVAQSLDLSIESNVEDLAGTLSVQAELAQTDNTFLTKPQIVEQNSGRTEIINYQVQAGETVPTLATKFGISEDTIRWANSLNGDAVTAGKTLLIPPTTGVIYTVKSGDTVAQLAERFKADTDRIVLFNDLELTGLIPGARITIPSGVAPAVARTSTTSYRSIGTTIYAGNRYARGYCTWWAYQRRAELGRPVGSNWHNATTWDDFARVAGYVVNHVPKAGAVIQDNYGWSRLGHVGVVERVNPDGSIYVSDMNYAGWNKVSYRTVPANQVASYNYIH